MKWITGLYHDAIHAVILCSNMFGDWFYPARRQEASGREWVLIFIAVMNMLSKPRRFGPLSSADSRM